jgi:hypothetical protein
MYVTARKDFKEIMIPQIKTGKQISIDGIIYPSIAMAARRLNTTETTIICRCRSEKYPDWFRL